MRWGKILALIILCGGFMFAWWIFKPRYMDGDEFKPFMLARTGQTYSTWYLYKIDEDFYCFKYSGPIVDERYCVPRRDLIVRNRAGGGSEIGFVYSRTLFLRENRIPGAYEEPFVEAKAGAR